MMPITHAELRLSERYAKLESFGCKVTPGGAHIRRTMMLKEITLLLAALAPTATAQEYRRAAIEDNAIRKATQTTREKTFRHLGELYALSESVPLFRLYRELVQLDSQASCLLSLLVAWSRDPLLRGTTPAILNANPGTKVKKAELQRALELSFPNQYSALNIDKISRNAGSSWTQSGHLAGRIRKLRQHFQPRPAVLTLALILGASCEPDRRA